MKNSLTVLVVSILVLGLSVSTVFKLGKRVWPNGSHLLHITVTTAAALVFILIISGYFFSTFLINKWSLWASQGYFIPHESSVYSFKPVVQNEGSGEWWIYGEDENYYYYAGDGVEPYPYMTIKKRDTIKCPNFSPTDFNTWCVRNAPDQNMPTTR